MFIRISIQNRLKIMVPCGERACMISEFLSAAVRITTSFTLTSRSGGLWAQLYANAVPEHPAGRQRRPQAGS